MPKDEGANETNKLPLTKIHEKTAAFHRNARARIDYDRYLKGRSYQLFKRGIKTERTLVCYNRCLYYFCNFVKMTTEDIVAKYGDVNLEAARKLEFQRKIEDYCLMLQERVDKDEIKATSCMAMLPPVRLSAEMCDVPSVNWNKVFRLLPKSDLVASDEAYSHEQVKKMLTFCDLRARVIILFLATSGMRLGGLTGLKDKDITPLYAPEDPTRVIAAHLLVYSGTESEYDTFVTPDAWKAYEDYRNMRVKLGEVFTAETAAIIARRNTRKFIENGKTKPAYYGTIRDIIAAACHKADVMKVSPHYKQRFAIKRIHGFRKFFNTTLRSIRTPDGSRPAIPFISKERLMGHALINQHSLEDNYDRGDLVKELLLEYVKAVPALTFSDEARLALQVTKREKDVSEYKTLDVEMSQKDRKIRDPEAQMQAMQKDNDEIKELLKHPEKIFELMAEKEN